MDTFSAELQRQLRASPEHVRKVVANALQAQGFVIDLARGSVIEALGIALAP